MEQKKPSNLIRVTVYIAPSAYRKLKSVLALENTSVSEWFRQKINEKIDSK